MFSCMNCYYGVYLSIKFLGFTHQNFSQSNQFHSLYQYHRITEFKVESNQYGEFILSTVSKLKICYHDNGL